MMKAKQRISGNQFEQPSVNQAFGGMKLNQKFQQIQKMQQLLQRQHRQSFKDQIGQLNRINSPKSAALTGQGVTAYPQYQTRSSSNVKTAGNVGSTGRRSGKSLTSSIRARKGAAQRQRDTSPYVYQRDVSPHTNYFQYSQSASPDIVVQYENNPNLNNLHNNIYEKSEAKAPYGRSSNVQLASGKQYIHRTHYDTQLNNTKVEQMRQSLKKPSAAQAQSQASLSSKKQGTKSQVSGPVPPQGSKIPENDIPKNEAVNLEREIKAKLENLEALYMKSQVNARQQSEDTTPNTPIGNPNQSNAHTEEPSVADMLNKDTQLQQQSEEQPSQDAADTEADNQNGQTEQEKQLFEALNPLDDLHDKVATNQNDRLMSDVQVILENFEKTFISYINANFKTFTENDVQRLIKDELRAGIMAKLNDIQKGQFNKCDPFKISLIFENAQKMSGTNEEIVDQLRKGIALLINQMVKAVEDMEKCACPDCQLQKNLDELTRGMDAINHIFNDVHFKVMQIQDEIGQIGVTCTTTLSSHGHLKKFNVLEQQYKKLEGQNQILKQQLFDQTMEYKKLKDDFQVQERIANVNKKENFQLQNMAQIVDELRNDNKDYMGKIEELQSKIFGKEREIDTLRHQLKYGVVTGGISPGFDHSYPGPGGTVASGNLKDPRSKIELAAEEQMLLSQAHSNHIKWRENSATLIRLSSRFMSSMKELQKAVHNNKSANQDHVQREKNLFEQNKKDLEAAIQNITRQIEETKRDVIRMGSNFGNLAESQKQQSVGGTKEALNVFKNMLDFQGKNLNQAEKYYEKLNESQIEQQRYETNKQTENKESNKSIPTLNPTQAPNIAHYKPQELIRLELENNQLNSELQHLKDFTEQLQSKVDNLTECIQECNTTIYLKEQQIKREAQRIEVNNQEQKALIEGLQAKIKQLENSKQEESAEEKQPKSNKRKVAFDEEFENDLVDLKQRVKDTEDEIHQSKANKFSREKVEIEPTKASKRINPFRRDEELEEVDHEAKEQELMEKMNQLVDEKTNELLELTVQNQKQSTKISQQKDQLKAQENQLERTKQECTILQERHERAQKELLYFQSSMAEQITQNNEKMGITIAEKDKLYEKLRMQLDEERATYLQQNRKMHDLEADIQKKNDSLQKLHNELNDFARQKAQLEEDLVRYRKEAQSLNGLRQEKELLANKLKQFDQEINRNHEFIQNLQNDLTDCQRSKETLQDQLDKIASIKDRERANEVNRYQEEILKVTEQLQSEITELKQQVKAKDQEILYHQNTLKLRGEQSNQAIQEHANKLKSGHESEILKVRSGADSKLQELQQEIDDKDKQIDLLQQELAKGQNIEEKMQQREQELKNREYRLKRAEVQVNADREGLKTGMQDLEALVQTKDAAIKDLNNKLKEAMEKEFSNFEMRKQIDEFNKKVKDQQDEIANKQKAVDATDLAIEQTAKRNREVLRERDALALKLKEMDDEQAQKELGLKQMMIELENEKDDLRQQLKIAQDALSKNADEHSRQIKELREKLNDDTTLQKKIQQYEKQIASLQSDQARSGEADQISRKYETLQQKYKDLLNNHQRMLEQNQSDYSKLTQDYDIASSGAQQSASEVKKLRRDNTEKEKQIETLQKKVEEEFKNCAKMLQERDELKNKLQLIERNASYKDQSTQENINQLAEQLETKTKQHQADLQLREQKLQSIIGQNEAKQREVDELKEKIQKQIQEEIQRRMLQEKKDKEEQEQNEEILGELVKAKAENMEVKEENESLYESLNNLKSKSDQLDQKNKIISELESKLKEALSEVENAKKDKSKEEQAKADSEDDFWNRPSEVDGEDKSDQPKGRDSDLEKITQLEEQLKTVSLELTNAKQEVLQQLTIDAKKLNEVKKAFVDTQILMKKLQDNHQKKTEAQFKNELIKEVGRVNFCGDRYLLIQRHQSGDGQVYFVKESNIEEGAKAYLRQFIPSGNENLMSLETTEEMQKYLKDLDELWQERDELRDELKVLKDKMYNQSDDESQQDPAYVELKQEYDVLLSQCYEQKEENSTMLTEIAELRNRVAELNRMNSKSNQKDQLAKFGEKSLPSNLNEQQITYGKNLGSLLGESPGRGSKVTESADFSRAQESSDEKSDDKNVSHLTSLLEHVKSTIQTYLRKNPIIDKTNETLLPVLFSMLNLTPAEINDIAAARSLLPIYKIDDKQTKKQQKANKLQLSGQGSLGTSGGNPTNLTDPDAYYATQDAKTQPLEAAKMSDSGKKSQPSLMGLIKKMGKKSQEKSGGGSQRPDIQGLNLSVGSLGTEERKQAQPSIDSVNQPQRKGQSKADDDDSYSDDFE